MVFLGSLTPRIPLMNRQAAAFAVLIVAFLSNTCAAMAETPPAGQQAPELRFSAVARQAMGPARGFSLTVEVSNPGPGVLRYVGYRADSFDPPIQKGQMMPLYRVELKQVGKWQPHPIGWCGTGVDEIHLAAKSSATFGVWVPAGRWEAVRVGLAWHPAGVDKDAPPTITWSPEITRQEIRRQLPPLAVASDPRPNKTYVLRHADGDQVVSLLRAMFIVVDQQHPYVQFEFDEAGSANSLIVTASPKLQAQVAKVLALVDAPAGKGPRAGKDNGAEPLVMAYPVLRADDDAVAGVLRSLFLVVNHEAAYARFGYDARTRSLIAIASRAHQKQIAEVVALLDAPPTTVKGCPAGSEGDQSI
jgi:hypothetical protein